jgi:neutral ceramidase
MSDSLLVGVAEVEITPPIGTLMAGALVPRASTGVYDPLMLKALVLDDGRTRIVYAIFDLVALVRPFGDRLSAAAAAATGIPTEHILWSCTHTHNGPCTAPYFPTTWPDPVDHAWLDTLIDTFAACVKIADDRKAPMRVRRTRGYRYDLGHNRRIRFKDGREINTWLLDSGEEDVQSLGAAGPIDPEIGILAFEALNGTLAAVLFQYALHANSRWGTVFSGDYPAVVAARLRERYGAQVTTLFMPGACADQNPVRGTRELGDALAETIIAKLDARPPAMTDTTLGIRAADITVPLRDVHMDQEARLAASQWGPEGQAFFRDSQRDLQRRVFTELPARLTAWHIGDVAFATFPGELFVEHGLRVKAESLFPWTYPVELCNDCLGYLITEQAWAAGGYEALISSVTQVAPAGSTMMVDENLSMLAALRNAEEAV